MFEIFATKLSEAMVYAAGGSVDGTYAEDTVGIAAALIEGSDALAVGPGMTTAKDAGGFLECLLERLERPFVLDADALNIAAASGEVRRLLKQCAGRTGVVLTPHPGEAARLLNSSTRDVQGDRLAAAREIAREFGCVVVLKGARTVIAGADGKTWINPTGNPGLGTGGTGDVLTGCISGFLAQGASALAAARAGVYVHGLSADILAAEMGATGITAGDVATRLPFAIASVWRGEHGPSGAMLKKI
jgi:NAD(P)H-hydrate epimerase